ncbi:MAG: radical SAM protein [Desulfobacterales bacterium]|nr:radical SAM protein [Desulfobacterales bacterium]
MSPKAPRILLINPWIHDFAAYDFWARPLGLLLLAAILRQHGYRVTYCDCLDRFHPRTGKTPLAKRQGRGPFLKTPIARPPGLADVPRTFSRYGIPVPWLREDLAAMDPPDLILVTGLMTYWASGVAETIAELKGAFPGRPVVLGGIYATLLPDHARRHSGADHVVTGAGERAVLEVAAEFTGHRTALRFDPDDLDTHPLPALDLQRRVPFIPLLTARGCPYRCAYCAAAILAPQRRRRSPQLVFEEIVHWHRRFGVRDVAFYDDALLVDAEAHALPLFERIAAAGLNLRLHTPNALHIGCIDDRVARAMRRAGMVTIRLGLETTDFAHRGNLDAKVSAGQFQHAVACLQRAGFTGDQIGAYLLAGLPDQPLEAVEAAIATVRATGATPIPAHYSPIAGTRLWPAAKRAARYDLESDPVFANNAIWPCRPEGFSWNWLTRLKNLCAGVDSR